MHEIYDLNKCPLSDRNGTYGGAAGMKDGILFQDGYWIVKYPQNTKQMNGVLVSYTTAPLSEYTGSHVYQMLGFDAHETVLGIRRNKLVVACKDFCKQPGMLREIRTIKNYAGGELYEKLENTPLSSAECRFADLEEILLHLKYNDILTSIPDAETRFWDLVVIDILINNNDRNTGNWGALYEDGQYRLAPIFDNGAAFSNKADEDRMAYLLSDQQRFEGSAANTTTGFGIKNKQISARKMLSLDYPGLKDALKRNIPLIQKKMPEISAFIRSLPEEYNGYYVCSKLRGEFYIKSMECRMEKILVPAYQKVLEQTNKLNPKPLPPSGPKGPK